MTDKTGTLTDKDMIVKRFYVDWQKFGEPDASIKEVEGKTLCKSAIEKTKSLLESSYGSNLNDFFFCMTVCHTANVSKNMETG